MGEEDGDGFFGRSGVGCKGLGDGVAPELDTHCTDGCITGCVGYAGDVDIERADGEVGITGLGRDEGLEDVRGCVAFSGNVCQ